MKEVIDIIDYMRDLPDEMKTEAVCWHALRQNWYALRHIPHHLQTKEMQIYALKQDGSAMFYIREADLDDVIRIVEEDKE